MCLETDSQQHFEKRQLNIYNGIIFGRWQYTIAKWKRRMVEVFEKFRIQSHNHKCKCKNYSQSRSNGLSNYKERFGVGQWSFRRLNQFWNSIYSLSRKNPYYNHCFQFGYTILHKRPRSTRQFTKQKISDWDKNHH